MPRINVDSELFGDIRFLSLCQKIGVTQAAGAMLIAFRESQRFWGDGRKLIPIPIFKKIEHSDQILEVELARVEGDFVYVCGTREHHEWYASRKDAGRRGGLISQENRVKQTQANGKQTQAQLKQTQPSSSSSSYEGKKEKVKKEKDVSKARAFEELKTVFPRRIRPHASTRAWKHFERLSEHDSQQAILGAKNYAKLCAAQGMVGTEFVKDMANFISQRAWEDYLTLDAGMLPTQPRKLNLEDL